MIQANELRIGNWVKAPLWRNEGMHPQKVYSIKQIWGEYFINYDFKETGCEFGAKVESEVDPIKLTKEILLNCGFEQDSLHYFKNNGVIISVEDNHFEAFLGNNVVVLNYLHQLQNLYFALTNEELKIEL